ncbi:MAG: hypothetical protein ACOY3X_11975 [Pseudomonadota bacterium]
MIRNILAAGAFLLAVIANPALAAGGTVTLDVKSFQEIEVKDKNGKTTRQQVPVKKVVPGDEVIYVISYRNNGTQPADKVVITNPVPEPVMFRPGTSSAKGAVDVVSVDSGKSYGKLETLKIVAADGTTRAATGADVTHVQWQLASSVAPGASGSVSYRVVIE